MTDISRMIENNEIFFWPCFVFFQQAFSLFKILIFVVLIRKKNLRFRKKVKQIKTGLTNKISLCLEFTTIKLIALRILVSYTASLAVRDLWLWCCNVFIFNKQKAKWEFCGRTVLGETHHFTRIDKNKTDIAIAFKEFPFQTLCITCWYLSSNMNFVFCGRKTYKACFE